jgi:putative RNA 2'-phosphotransferase
LTTGRQTELSKALSHALRHEPWLYELEMDDDGWVPIGELLDSLRRDPRWRTLTRSELIEVVGDSHRARHEFAGDRIRARYGHSLPGRIEKVVGVPPQQLFHGTAEQSVQSILRTGLYPMGRQYVHLSVDQETALAVGRRKSARIVVLVIEALRAHDAGVCFLHGNAVVWLAHQIPPGYIGLGSVV